MPGQTKEGRGGVTRTASNYFILFFRDNSSGDYEKTPRVIPWEEEDEETEHKLHYLLPLKESHGRLVHQKPTVLTMQGQRE